MNYDNRTLIMQNVRRINQEEVRSTYTVCQYRILCNLIRQKKITEPFFKLVLSSLYNLQDWKKLNYSQMYELIHVLTYYNYGKGYDYE